MWGACQVYPAICEAVGRPVKTASSYHAGLNVQIDPREVRTCLPALNKEGLPTRTGTVLGPIDLKILMPFLSKSPQSDKSR